MKVKIANRDEEIELKAGVKLLDGLAEKGYRLMSSCGGMGSCGMCRVKVLEGLKEPKEEYFGPLSEDLKKEGWVLACQLPVEADLVIQLEEKLVERWPGEEVAEGEVEEPELSPLGRKLRRALPGFNCSGNVCGYPTCFAYAEALARGEASPGSCLPGGEPVRAALSRILEAEAARRAFVQTILEGISERVQLDREADHRLYLRTSPQDLKEVAARLFERGGRLVTASGVDKPESNEIELLYHISFDRSGMMVSLRTALPRNEPRSESVASFLPAAEFIEREIRELLGVEFVGHPRQKRLIKAEEIPDDVYPLRKDFRIEEITRRS
ncbi:MAG: NADH-quinone oxidoreductase subunit C [Candidatus Bipolaricaulia bacterium]